MILHKSDHAQHRQPGSEKGAFHARTLAQKPKIIHSHLIHPSSSPKGSPTWSEGNALGPMPADFCALKGQTKLHAEGYSAAVREPNPPSFDVD